MVLRGILEASFGNYVCIRGFAPLRDLAEHSKIDDSYQRHPDKKHVEEIAEFIKRGKYLYSPEVILGLPCDKFTYVEEIRERVHRKVTGGYESALEVTTKEVSLYNALRNMVLSRHEQDPKKCSFYNRKFGDLKVTVGQRKNYFDRLERALSLQGEDVPPLFLNVAIADLEKASGGSPIYCIDGNHRLEAAKTDADVKNNLVPFSLILFENDDVCREQGAVLFHNINYHPLPISDERNARTIVTKTNIEGKDLFSSSSLLSSPSFGRGEYYFVRKVWKALVDEGGLVGLRFDTSFFKAIFSNEEESGRPLTFLRSVFKVLFDRIEARKPVIKEDVVQLFDNRPRAEDDVVSQVLNQEYDICTDKIVDDFIHILRAADRMLSTRSDLGSENLNEAVVAALVALGFYQDNRYQSYFLDNVVKRRWGRVKSLSVKDVLSLFEEQMERKKRTIFVSMPFYKYACDYHYQVIEDVVRDINRDYQEQLGDVLLDCHKVDRNDTGKTFEINQKVADSIAECGLLIADLTYSNVNVFHEVGMMMGRTFAQQGHTNEFDMILLCDESESSVTNVEYNLHSLQMVCFKHPDELRVKLKKRLLDFCQLSPNEADRNAFDKVPYL